MLKSLFPGQAFNSALKHEAELNRAMLDHLPMPVWLSDADGRLLAANHHFLQTVGAASIDDIAGKSLAQLFTDDIAPFYQAAQHPLGQALPADLHLGWLSEPSPAAQAAARRPGCANNCTLALARHALDSLNQCVLLCDEDFRITYANASAHRQLGYEPSELTRRPLTDLLPELGEAQLHSLALRLPAAPLGIPFDGPHQRKDGSRFPASCHVTRLEGERASILFVSRDATSIQQLANSLRRERERLTEAQHLAGLGSWELDLQTGTLDWSPGMYRLLDLDPAVFPPCADSLLATVHPDDQPLVRETNEEIQAGRGGHQIEFRVLARDCSLRHLHGRCHTVRDAQGVARLIRGTLQDVSQRKLFESELERQKRELQDARNRLATIVNTIPDLIWLKDTNGVYLACNPAFERFFGAPEAEILGKTDHDFVPAELADFFRQKDMEAMAAGTVRINEEEIVYADSGRPGRLETRKVPVLDARGEIAGVLGVARDITDTLRLEGEVLRREREFRSLVEHSPDAIARYDREGRCLYGNPAMQALTGLDAATLAGRTPAEMAVFSGGPGEAYLRLLHEAAAGDASRSIELPWKKEAQQSCLQLRVTPEFGADGQLVSLLAVGRDISALKQVEEELRASRQLLRQHARQREDALEGERRDLSQQIHEELAQNLSALRLNVSLLGLQQTGEPPPSALQSMRSIIDRCMAQTRSMAISLRPPVLDAGIVLALHWLTDQLGQTTEIDFHLDLPEELALPDDITTYLFRAVQESLTNTLRRAFASEVTLKLDSDEANWCTLTIRDNGRGFAPETLHPEKTFGLLWMQEQAAQLGGRWEIHSSPGRGTETVIRMPRGD